MDIVDMAIHPLVFQKSGSHRNIDFQNSRKTYTSTRISGQNMLAFQRYIGVRN
jgi:hypothetical protein